MEREARTFSDIGKCAVDWISAYWESFRRSTELPFLASHPGNLYEHLSKVQPNAPTEPETFNQVMDDFKSLVLPQTLHWMSPHFHAYFPCGNSAASLTADMLSGAINAIGFSWGHMKIWLQISNPSGTELEMYVVDWLAKMMGLPEDFCFSSGKSGGGSIIGSASEATLMAMLAAREKVISRQVSENPFVVMSKLAHSSVRRAGLLSRLTIRLIPLERKTHRMDSNALDRRILRDIELGLIPFFVCVTLGTTGVCAFDDLSAVGALCRKYALWLHVDAAYGGNALICPEYQHYLHGAEDIDSMVVSPHKWMMVNYDCSVIWFRSRDELTIPFVVDPEYLRTIGSRNKDSIPDFRHYGIPCGRRFRALKLWFVIRLHGVSGLQENIRRQVRHGGHLVELLILDPRFQLVSSSMGVIAFRLKGKNKCTEKLLHDVNHTGKIRLIHTKIGGKIVIRFVADGIRSDDADVAYAWKTIQQSVDSTTSHPETDSRIETSADSQRTRCRRSSDNNILPSTAEDSDVFYTDDDD